jgi:hypothetical protein
MSRMFSELCRCRSNISCFNILNALKSHEFKSSESGGWNAHSIPTLLIFTVTFGLSWHMELLLCTRRICLLSREPSEFSRPSILLEYHPANNSDRPSLLLGGHTAPIFAIVWKTSHLYFFDWNRRSESRNRISCRMNDPFKIFLSFQEDIW